MSVICYILGNNCYAACRGHPFTCGAHNHCHCHNPDTCDSHSGPVCLSSECGGTRKCVESKCHCEYHCSGVDDCRNFPCKFGTPECADKMCSCNDPCKWFSFHNMKSLCIYKIFKHRNRQSPRYIEYPWWLKASDLQNNPS